MRCPVFRDKVIPMNEMKDYNLTTGQFAQLCNTTRDTLRHYNEIGILKPRKDPENGYYYYSVSQISTFYFINSFRSMNSSLSDIRDCMDSTDINDFYDFYRKQLQDLANQKRELEYKITGLNNAVALMRYMRRIPENTPTILTFKDEPAYCSTPVKSKSALHSGDIAEDISEHIEKCKENRDINAFPVAATIDRDDFLKGLFRYKELCSFVNPQSRTVEVHFLNTRRVVACSCYDGEVDIRTIYRSIIDFISERKLTACSDLFSISMVNYLNSKEEHRYLKYLFIGIE